MGIPRLFTHCPKLQVFSSHSPKRKFFGVWDRDNKVYLIRQHCFPDATFEAMHNKIEFVLTMPQNYIIM